MNELDDANIAAGLPPIALDVEDAARIRARVRGEVATRRAQLLDGALHAGFAVAAVAWALLVVVVR